MANMTQTPPLPQRLEQRLKALRQEFETGQKMLADLEARRVELQQTLLRIGGAIQVLEELIDDTETSGPDPAAGLAIDEGARAAEPG
jgi:hypothetical protein